MELEVGEFHREDYYLAQIAAEIRRPNVKVPRSVRVEDFILKFTTTGSKKKQHPSIAESKAFWMGSLGLKVPREE